MTGPRLVAMRLMDMRKVHPGQDNSRVCCKCGQQVGLYPTGVKAFKQNPGIEVWCLVCMANETTDGDEVKPAGTIEEIRAEIEASKPVNRA